MSTREVAKKAVREQICLAALARFEKQGFDRTTVDEIAADVGMSTRTFFRYFRSKEDALLDPTRDFTTELLRRLSEQMPSDDIWTCLGVCIEGAARHCTKIGQPGQSSYLQELVQTTPALASRQLAISEQLQKDATQLCLDRSPQARALGKLATNATVRAAFSCLQTVREQLGGDIQSGEALQEFRRLMSDFRPHILNLPASSHCRLPVKLIHP